MGREQKGGRKGVGEKKEERRKVPFFPLPHPLPSTFLLSPHFSRVPNGKNLNALPEYGNACYAGYFLPFQSVEGRKRISKEHISLFAIATF